MSIEMDIPFQINDSEISELCHRWKISELSLFGSALRDDFGPESDIDFLVTFAGEAKWILLDFVRLKHELEARFQPPVDLVQKDALRNPYRRRSILSSYKVLYAA